MITTTGFWISNIRSGCWFLAGHRVLKIVAKCVHSITVRRAWGANSGVPSLAMPSACGLRRAPLDELAIIFAHGFTALRARRMHPIAL